MNAFGRNKLIKPFVRDDFEVIFGAPALSTYLVAPAGSSQPT